MSYMSYIEKKFPLDAKKTVAYRLNFHNIISVKDRKITDFGIYSCSSCHHIKQTVNLTIPKSSLKKEYGRLSFFGFCVSIECKESLVNTFDDISENDFRPVTAKNGDLLCYQLTPQHTMEPIYPYNSEIKPYHCNSCGTTFWIEPINETVLYITEQMLNKLSSLNLTFEHTPLSQGSIIVTKDVYNFLINKYPKMEFTPILLKQ